MDSPQFASARVSDNGRVQHADDSSKIIVFYLESVKQGFASEKAGRDIHKDVPYVWIRFVGDRTREVKREVRDIDKEEFPKQWLAFERQQEVAHEGTPIENWPAVGKSTALNLKSLNVHTVEQLAAVNDGLIMNLGTGATDLREKAKVWLSAAKDSAEVLKLQTELKRRDDRIDDLERQVKEIASMKSKKD